MIDVKRRAIKPVVFRVEPSILINNRWSVRVAGNLLVICDESVGPPVFDEACAPARSTPGRRLLIEINGRGAQFIVRYRGLTLDSQPLHETTRIVRARVLARGGSRLLRAP